MASATISASLLAMARNDHSVKSICDAKEKFFVTDRCENWAKKVGVNPEVWTVLVFVLEHIVNHGGVVRSILFRYTLRPLVCIPERLAELHPAISKDCFQVKSNLLTDFRFTTHEHYDS
jgi:hypothetical protein